MSLTQAELKRAVDVLRIVVYMCVYGQAHKLMAAESNLAALKAGEAAVSLPP